MFIGRKEELRQLENYFSSEHSNLLVVYGRVGMGKTTLALKFCEGRNYLYYKATECSIDDQITQINKKIAPKLNNTADKSVKRILVIDEFTFAACEELKNRVLNLVRDEEKYGPVMVLLLSSSINWVENSMVSEYKELARSISGIIKLKEISFAETVEWFPKTTASDCVIIRAVLGGIPKYLNLWQENRRVRENIISLFFSMESPLINEAEYVLKGELRELGAYNTILCALASGKNKLNDIFEATGFGRAKISVYLKNLAEMDIVEKIYSVNVKNSENTKKGLYRIKDSFINFYYAYVFPNMSEIECAQGKLLYNKVLLPDFDRYMRRSFSDVCREYLELMSKYKRLGKRYSQWYCWYGKKGTLDIIGLDNEKNAIVGMCHYSDAKAGDETLDEMKDLINEAGIIPTKLCIFSKSGFEHELIKSAKEEQIMTVSLSDL